MNDKKVAQMKQQVAEYMGKKDYYEILGVSKTATEGEIKTAYRKLALRFHPDKNSVEGAKEVFKKVSNAYTTLINVDKRSHYDRFGPEEHRPQQHRHRQEYAYAQDQEFEQMNDIFRAFFRNMNNGHNNNFHTFSFNMGGQANAERQARGNQGFRFNFSYVFMLFAIIYLISPIFKETPHYSLVPSYEYNYKITTSIIKVPFYVRKGYFQQIKKDKNILKKIENYVEYQYIQQLSRDCEKARRDKNRIEQNAYYYNPGTIRDSYLKKANQVDQTSCSQLYAIREKHSSYIQELFYSF